jgi:pyruvate kinase
MVARGDLAVEVPFEQIPGVQRMIIKKCNKYKKPVIVATQMLHSMIKNTRPTRAEVNDVASAVYRRTDAVMLSGETAFGKYPVESVATMAKIAGEVEKTKDNNLDMPVHVINTKVSDYLAKYAVEASIELEATAIIADTNTGRTIRALSGYQGHKPVFAICYSKKTMRELALSFGIIPLFMKPKTTTHAFIIEALQKIKNEYEVHDNDHVVILAGNFGAGRGASFIEIGTVKNLMSVKT